MKYWLCKKCAQAESIDRGKRNTSSNSAIPQSHAAPVSHRKVVQKKVYSKSEGTHRVRKAKIEPRKAKIERKIDKVVQCEVCGKTFGSRQGLGGHKRVHNANNSAKKDIARVPKELDKVSKTDGQDSKSKRKGKMGSSPAGKSRLKRKRSNSSQFHGSSNSVRSAMSPLLLEAHSLSSNAEEKLLRMALEISRKSSQVCADLDEIPDCPVFHPTPQEFSDPIKYIRKLHSIGEKWGIVRVVPPKTWKPGFHINPDTYQFSTRQQHVHKLQEAQGFDEGKDYTLAEYQNMARTFEVDHLLALGVSTAQKNSEQAAKDEAERSREIRSIERRYWQVVTTGSPEIVVEYGNDVDSGSVGSGFAKDNKWQSSGPGGWNLNRIAVLRQSPLHHLSKSIKGVTVPWVYCGMIFSSFCWHCEDNHLPSINYLHKGAPKVWYAASAEHSKRLERAMKAHMPLLFHREPDLMQKLVTMLDPSTLVANGVPVCRGVQREGSFIITFPRGYHCGFNAGFNVAEAVNLAYDEWFPYGRQCIKRYREMRRSSVFPHAWLLLRYAEQRRLEKVEGTSAVADPDDDVMLKRELRVVFEEEDRLRSKARKAGVERVLRMDVVKEDSSMRKEYLHHRKIADPHCKQCHMCHTHCFLSYMTCFCQNQKKVVCLNHIRYLCACKPSNKALFVRDIDRRFFNLPIAKIKISKQ